MLADDAQPTTRRKLAKQLYARKRPCSPPHTRRRRCHELAAEQAIRPAVVNRKVWRNRTAGSRHPSEDDEPHPHRRQQELDVTILTRLSRTHPEDVPRFRVERPPRLPFIEMG